MQQGVDCLGDRHFNIMLPRQGQHMAALSMPSITPALAATASDGSYPDHAEGVAVIA